MNNNSCEVKYYRYTFKLILFVSLFVLFMFSFVLFLPTSESGIILGVFIGWAILFLPFLIYYGIKLRYFLHVEPSYIQEVKLEKIVSSWNRLAGFSIIMEIDGVKKKVNTLAIFNIGYFGPNLLDDYSSKKALVGYDPKKNIALVLELIN